MLALDGEEAEEDVPAVAEGVLDDDEISAVIDALVDATLGV